jgi:hypothetical protein
MKKHIFTWCLGLLALFQVVAQNPTIQPIGGSTTLPVYGVAGITLSAIPHPSYAQHEKSYEWHGNYSGSDQILNPDDDQVSSITVFKPGTYFVRIYYYTPSTVTGTSTNTVISASPAPPDLNTMVSSSIELPGIKSETDLPAFILGRSHGQSASITYSDGLARPIQSILPSASPSGLDVVQPFTYDPSSGRMTTAHLPYTKGTDGYRNPVNAVTEQQSFYNTTGQKRAVSSVAQASGVVENSPLARLKEVGDVGTDYQIATGKTTKLNTRTNVANEVVAWTFNPATKQASGTTYVPAGTLLVSEVTNAQNQVTQEYVNRNGQVLLKRYKVSPSASLSNPSSISNTYYVYDEKGRLVYEVPYLASLGLGGNIATWTFNDASTVCKEAMHYYQYDALDRVW